MHKDALEILRLHNNAVKNPDLAINYINSDVYSKVISSIESFMKRVPTKKIPFYELIFATNMLKGLFSLKYGNIADVPREIEFHQTKPVN